MMDFPSRLGSDLLLSISSDALASPFVATELTSRQINYMGKAVEKVKETQQDVVDYLRKQNRYLIGDT